METSSAEVVHRDESDFVSRLGEEEEFKSRMFRDDSDLAKDDDDAEYSSEGVDDDEDEDEDEDGRTRKTSKCDRPIQCLFVSVGTVRAFSLLQRDI